MSAASAFIWLEAPLLYQSLTWLVQSGAAAWLAGAAEADGAALDAAITVPEWLFSATDTTMSTRMKVPLLARMIFSAVRFFRSGGPWGGMY